MFHNIKRGNPLTQKIIKEKEQPKVVDLLNPSITKRERQKQTHVPVQNPKYTVQHLTTHLQYLQNQLYSAENGTYLFSTISMGALGAGIGKATKANTTIKDKRGKVVKQTKEESTTNIIFAGAIGGLLGHFIDKKRQQRDIQYLRNEIRITKQKIAEAKTDSNFIDELMRSLNMKQSSISPTIDLPKGVVTGQEIADMNFDFYEMGKSFFGLLWGRKVADPFYAISYGLPSQGKSTFAISFADYFMNEHGKTLYLASEQGVAMSLQNIIKSTKGLNIHLDGSPKNKTVDQHIKDIKKYNYKLVVIDSATHMRYTHDDIEYMRKQTPGVSYLVILQAIKDGDFKGDNQWAHNCDIMIKVHDRKAYTTKSRFLEAKADWYNIPAHR